MENALVNRLCLPFSLLFGLLVGHAQIGKQEAVFIRFEPSKVHQKKIYSDGIVFYLKDEYLEVKNIQNIDTFPVAIIPPKLQLTMEEVIAKENKIMKDYAEEVEKKLGIPFPKTTMYHDFFDLYIVETIELGKQVKYPVTWRYGLPFRETEKDL